MNKKIIQEPKIKILAKITPHSIKDRLSSQLPVFFCGLKLVGGDLYGEDAVRGSGRKKCCHFVNRNILNHHALKGHNGSISKT